ncbi:hypothetical protein COCOBI_13-2950 [Coccomyxa sp. Obi]|nr:hypothetical protein COCOBI_13-2950 [Coccomyxa sp. Obi]
MLPTKGVQELDVEQTGRAQDYRCSKTAMVWIPVLLLLTLGTAIAPLCAVSKGWAYYHSDSYLGHSLQIWAGYVKGTDTVSQRLHQIAPAQFAYYHKLKEVSMAGQVWGGIEAGLLSLSIIAILTFLSLWALVMLRQKGKRCSRRLQKAMGAYLWPTALLSSVILFLSAMVMFILLGVGVAQYTTDHLGRKFIPWPHWAWWVAIVNSWLWAIITCVARIERNKEKAANLSHLAELAPQQGVSAPAAVWPDNSTPVIRE